MSQGLVALHVGRSTAGGGTVGEFCKDSSLLGIWEQTCSVKGMKSSLSCSQLYAGNVHVCGRVLRLSWQDLSWASKSQARIVMGAFWVAADGSVLICLDCVPHAWH